jgi:hypothetical protein
MLILERWLTLRCEMSDLHGQSTSGGFVIYRCTDQNDSDWEKFIVRFLRPVPKILECYNGLDLDKFAPTVFEGRSSEGATVAILRDHFNQCATTALQDEHGVQNGNR